MEKFLPSQNLQTVNWILKDAKMTQKLLQFSIVVLATDHNPTILNPGFLRLQKIVPEDWE
jgi:hypothetical protein